MKEALGLLFALSVSLASAAPITYDLSGVLTAVDLQNVSNFGMQVGSTFTGTLSWEYFDGCAGNNFLGVQMDDPHRPPDAPYHQDGWFHVVINVGGQIMQTGSGGQYVAGCTNDGSSGDLMSLHSTGGDTERTPWGSVADTYFNMSFQDNSGTAVNSSLLPSNFDLSRWIDGHSFNFEGQGGFHDPFFNIVGDITSVILEKPTSTGQGSSNVPDTGTTLALVGLGFLSLTAARYKRQPTR